MASWRRLRSEGTNQRRTEEKHSPARGNRKWLQGDEREALGDMVGEQARMVMLGLGKVFGYCCKHNGSHKRLFTWRPTLLDLHLRALWLLCEAGCNGAVVRQGNTG